MGQSYPKIGLKESTSIVGNEACVEAEVAYADEGCGIIATFSSHCFECDVTASYNTN